MLLRLANLLLKVNQVEKAVGVYKHILSLDEQVVGAWFNLAHAQIKLGDHAGMACPHPRYLGL